MVTATKKVALVDVDIVETDGMTRRDMIVQLHEAGIRIVARAKITATKDGELIIIGKKHTEEPKK